jgi:thymidylate synthase
MESLDQNKEEQAYLDLLKSILDKGFDKPNRTGTDSRSLTGTQLRFTLYDKQNQDLEAGSPKMILPLLTTKQTSFRLILTELLWFLEGECNALVLATKYNNHIWDANGSREFLDKMGFKDRAVGDLGKVYGVQWRHWNQNKPWNDGIDQITQVIEAIKRDPYGRRHIVTAWNPEQIPEMALPPCFLAGTLVLTKRGYIPIENVELSDELLSHNGNYNNINQKHITEYSGNIHNIKVKFHPHIIKVTPEHPFYAKIDKSSEPQWLKVKELTVGNFLGFPINNKNEIPSFRYEAAGNQYSVLMKTFKLDNPEYWFMMGCYLGDGWLDWNSKKYRFYFVFNHDDMKTSFVRISKILTLHEVRNNSTGCRKFECRMKNWWTVLREFGHLAHNKIIPEWVHNAPKEYIQAFIDGFIAADGCKTMSNKLICATTVSPHIAFGMQRLYAKLGVSLPIHFQIKPKTHIIEGRTVNQRDLYSICKNKNEYNSSFTFIDKDYIWFMIMENTTSLVDNTKVYNFDVENDHTYIVENIATHNCHYAFQFVVRPFSNNDKKPYWLDCILTQRSADMPLGVPFNIASYATLTHMVSLLTDLHGGELIINMGDCHIYHNQFDGCRTQLERVPQPFPELRFKRIPSNIDDFKVEDFELVGYNPAPAIKFPFST